MRYQIWQVAILAVWLFANGRVIGQNAANTDLASEYTQQILPLMQTHCLSCHGEQTPEAELDLSVFQSADDVNRAHPIWGTVAERVEAGEMPPEDAEKSLGDRDRQRLLNWIRAVRKLEAERTAGDPGRVLVRRLSNAEYDNTIRDLTGVDIRPTQNFPVDPANEAGFDNSGESLRMSPALLNKYLEAARSVASHLVLTPNGIRFAPHPVMTDTDRDKYCVKRIVEFYYRQPTDLAEYFVAAWKYHYREQLGKPQATLADIAWHRRLSPKYLSIIYVTLQREDIQYGPLAKLQSMWRRLPKPDQVSEHTESAKLSCRCMQDYVLAVRPQLSPTFENLEIDGVHNGTQAFVLWKNKQYARHRQQADFSQLDKQTGPRLPKDEVIQPPTAEERTQFERDCQKFCEVFPDAFYVSERGRDYLGKPRDEQEKGRLLSAGFHSMMGYFRDDAPLMNLILDDEQQQQLNSLWQELDFFTSAPHRQYQGFLWFDRTDSRFMRDPVFDFARPEDKAALAEPVIQRLAEVYLAKATAAGGTEVPLQAIRDYFIEINQQIRWVEQARIQSEPCHLDAIVEFAERANRQPLTTSEENDLRSFYRSLRDGDELTHAEAIQDTLVSILISPKFCYRLDLLSDSPEPEALDDYELASRLSYFLWSSMPDQPLLQQAAAGKLRDPQILLAQTRRMLADPRINGLATEFAGNWLDIRRFQEHNSVDRERFSTFNDQLRSAMFEEPLRYFVDMVQNDSSILELLYGKHTFVNSALAEHYGMQGLDLTDGEWRRIPDATAYDRGGLLPMAVFLTKNAPGLRTSPVKRGYWVVRRLLGERIPPPPPNVPELPNDESQLGELTLREALAKHRDHASCAGCHNRIDSIGLVFEGFGPVGERREVDLGGRPVDTRAEFPDGSYRSGVAELQAYLRESRQTDFVDNFTRKLLSYALGRSLQLSDESLLESMQSALERDDYRIGSAIETIVASPQFLNKRG